MKTFAPETMQNFEQEAVKRLHPESLKRYQRKDSIGLFEFKLKLEDVVMEHVGLKPKTEAQKQEKAAAAAA